MYIGLDRVIESHSQALTLVVIDNRTLIFMAKQIIIIFIALILETNLFGQNTTNKIDTFPILSKDFKKTANWIKADSDRHFYYAQYGDTLNLLKAISIIKHNKNFLVFLQAKTYCIDNYKISIPKLIEMLTDTTKVGLTNTADLIIWDRLQTKDLEFYGHGGIINEDIFTVAGRSSYILNELTDENFAHVHVATSLLELKTFQELWKAWFRQL